jgi:hypothetical protein
MNIVYKLRDFVILVVIVLLAFWLSPFILLGVVFYLFYRVFKLLQQKKLFARIEKEWFPQSKYVFFLYSDSRKWKEYFESELIPKIQDKASIWNWSTRAQSGWGTDSIEAQIFKLHRPLGRYYPIAIVFIPGGVVKTFQFYTAYVDMIKSGDDRYKSLENEFLALVEAL